MNEFNNIFEKLSNLQKRLMKNYKNPVFKNSEKNKLLKKYNQLGRLGKSLFRYSTLLQNNLLTNEEEDYISNMVLKGGISNYRYIWHSENSDKTCNECASLDGKVYNFQDEVPEPLHPNCRCWVEVVEEKNRVNKKQDEDEPCDCWARINILIENLETNAERVKQIKSEIEVDIDEFNSMLSKASTLIAEKKEEFKNIADEYGMHLKSCKNYTENIFGLAFELYIKLQYLLSAIMNSIYSLKAYLLVFTIFSYNYMALLYEAYVLKESGMDKYRHSVANCQATQLGELEERAAVELSNFKEKYDQYQNSYARTHKVSIEEALADSEQDQIANKLGRERGRNNPSCDCRILMEDLKPIPKQKK